MTHDQDKDQTAPEAPRQTEVVLEVQEPDQSLPEMTMADLPPNIAEALGRAGWSGLTPVQSRSLPYLLAGRDLMVQSRTGSGKTGAFLLPILHGINPDRPVTQALILVPTRELARQVAGEAHVLSGGRCRVLEVYGGVGYGKQMDGLKDGAHIIVGTPGRVLDHLLRRTMTLDDLRYLVFDEADRMLSIGFYPDMVQVKRYLPKRRVMTLLFSATYPPFVLRLAGEFMRDPQMLSLSSKQVHIAEIEHAVYEVPGMGRERALLRIIEAENPASAMIFCNTKANVEFVAEVLKNFGHDADGLTGDLSQAKREQIMDRARQGRLRFLVATDVAARGIDIPELSHVFLYEPPEDPESYIHRAGRTGRAGAGGVVISLANVLQKLDMERLAKRYQIDLVNRPLPTDEDVQRIAAERLTTLLEAELRQRKPLMRERMRRFLPLAAELGQSEDGQALIAMLLDDVYQTSLHKAPELPPEAPKQPSRRAGRDEWQDDWRDDEERPGRRGGRGNRQERDERRPKPEARRKDAAEAGDGVEEAAQRDEARAEAPGDSAGGEAKKRKRRRRRKKKPGSGEGGGAIEAGGGAEGTEGEAAGEAGGDGGEE